jgi:predicted dinucleotide-binding enzyme
VDTPPSVALLMDVVLITSPLSAIAVMANRLDDNEADAIVVVVVVILDETVTFSNRVGGGVIDTVGPDVVGGAVLFEP